MVSRDDDAARGFEKRYGCLPQFVSVAPGRVNLIGEHTDYNGGFVLPAAINRSLRIAARVRRDDSLNLYSETFNESVSFSISARIRPPQIKGWYSYFAAVVDRFMDRGASVPGMDVSICGDVPLGAGLSSSAAFEVCAAVLLDRVCDTKLSRKDLALLSQKAEHSDYVGVKCGIMDQFISALGEKDHALLVDCFTLEPRLVPFDSASAFIVIVNSMKKRGLMDSEYNMRRSECEKGFQLIKNLSRADFPSIRHIPSEIFDKYKKKLPEKSRMRLAHNLSENQRVQDFVQALKYADFAKAGILLYESHESLKSDYEVSCEELDRIVEIASLCEGVYGCRMTGAGFGGCAVALVLPAAAEEFSKRMISEYDRAFHLIPEIYITPPAPGAFIREIKE